MKLTEHEIKRIEDIVVKNKIMILVKGLFEFFSLCRFCVSMENSCGSGNTIIFFHDFGFLND